MVDGGELWSVARGVKIAELGRIYGEPATMFSADGKHLLTHGPSAQADDKVSGNEVRVFALDKAPILRVFRTDEQIGRCAITADGSLVAASLVDGNILLLRPDARGLVLADTIEHDVIVDGLIFSADKRILLAESRGNILIWRVDTGKLAGPILSPDFRLQIVRLSHDGTLVAAIGKSALRIWDTRSGEPVTPKLTVPGSILDAAFRADDSRFSVVLTTTVVYSWDLSPVRLPVGQLASLAELLAGESRNQESGIRERLP